MRVLIFGNSSMGFVKFRAKLIKRLQDNHEVFVATPLDGCVEDMRALSGNICEVQINRRGTNPFQELTLIRKYQEVIRRVKPDYIITYTVKPNIYAGFLAGMKKIPYAANITGLGTAFQKEGLLKKAVVSLYRIALKKADIVFFENSANAEVFVKNGITDEQKICVLNGAGVDLQDFAYAKPPVNEKTEFLFMGRLMKEKGIEELLYAIEKLYEENPKVRLTILGEYEENYKIKVEQLHERGIINYVGLVTDVRPYIRQCDCSILPSYHEGMSNTLLESASMGRPVIASDIPGCRETMIDGTSGYLVQVADKEDLLCKMRKFTTLTYEERTAMGIEARRHMESKFDKAAIVEKTIVQMGLQMK